MGRGVVTPHGIVLMARGTVLTAHGTEAVVIGAARGIEAARGVVTLRGIVLTARGTVLTARGTEAAAIAAVRGIEAARGVVMLRGIGLTARGTVLTVRGITAADVAVALAHSTGRPDFPCRIGSSLSLLHCPPPVVLLRFISSKLAISDRRVLAGKRPTDLNYVSRTAQACRHCFCPTTGGPAGRRFA